MTTDSPDLLTLLRWATQMAAGERCAAWEAWCSASPDAAGKWERITQAQELLDGGVATVEEDDTISPDLLAAYVEGGLARAEAEQVEQRLWESPELLAEALSSVRFTAQSPKVAATDQLQQRLLALAPQSMNGHVQVAPVLYRLAPVKKSKWLAPIDRPMTALVLPESDSAARAAGDAVRRQWLALAAALFLIFTLSAAVSWLAFGRRDVGREQSIAKNPETRKEVPPQPREEREPPSVVPQETRQAEPPQTPLEVTEEPLAKSSEPARPVVNEIPAAPPPIPQLPPPRIPQPRAPSRALPPPPELAFESAQGILLVEASSRGKWRVAKDKQVLREPLKFVSLAESWTIADVPGVATLVCEGTAELTLSQLIDGVLEVRLDRGRVGLRELADGAEIRVLVGDAAWTARGLEPHSILAVFHDPLNPGLAVPQGSVTLNDTPINTRQFLRWQNGVLEPFDVLTSASGANPGAPPAVPPLIHPWDLDWLTPPDEVQRKQWQMVYGRLIDRLANANDFEAELTRMLATSRDPRQATLLARWSAASEPPASRARRIWNMLSERRGAVRVAGVMSLLELPPGDVQRTELLAMVAQATNAATGGQVAQWLDATRQPAPLGQVQAAELTTGLTHEQLAVRQIAASLLELHTTTALHQAGRLPPAYDATGPLNRRAAAQQEWRAVLRQLFTAARSANGALGPSLLKPVP